MKKILQLWALSGLMALVTTSFAVNQPPAPEPAAKTIGIVLPLDHVALREIVAGFKDSLAKNYPGKVRFEVDNAQHDLNVQRAIIQKFINQKVDLIVPVATATTQMAMSMVKNQPILGLAAMIPDSARDQNGLANRYTGVRDEIDSAKQIDFMKVILPQMKKMTLIYSADDKVIPEAQTAIAAAKKKGISVQPLMIQNLSDLYSVSQRVAKDSQAIFILKDNLVVSGINTLVTTANNRHLPLITSDEGTVAGGAATALGVAETEIGIQGGELAAKILQGQPIQQLPIESIRKLHIFVNAKTAAQQGLDMAVIQRYAQQQGYSVKLIASAAP